MIPDADRLDLYFTDSEPPHEASPTGSILDAMALFGGSPGADDPELRPMPDESAVRGALDEMFDALVSTVAATALEPELEQMAWSLANLFHRATERLERRLDDNERAQDRSRREQDASEVRSVELERLLTEGLVLIDRRNGLELMRDHAAHLFEVHTGSAWRPRAGSLASRRTLTAAVIDSRDFTAARRRAEIEVLVPPGPKVAFTGGNDCNDHHRIWEALDRVLAKHEGMVLLHGGSPRGAERIAACWADSRKVVQIAFKPDWTRNGRAAPFKRNDQLLDVLPIGVVVFPGSGISDNLADKARKLGIPLFDFRPPRSAPPT